MQLLMRAKSASHVQSKMNTPQLKLMYLIKSAADPCSSAIIMSLKLSNPAMRPVRRHAHSCVQIFMGQRHAMHVPQGCGFALPQPSSTAAKGVVVVPLHNLSLISYTLTTSMQTFVLESQLNSIQQIWQ